MNVAFQRNIGSFLTTLPAFASTTFTAGSGNDGVAQNGLTIDRDDKVSNSLSGLLSAHCLATLAESETALVEITFEDSANGSDWAAYDPGPPDPTYEGTTLSADGHAIVTRKIQLGGARRYVRAKIEVTLSAANTDTVVVDAQLIMGGSDELPYEDGSSLSA